LAPTHAPLAEHAVAFDADQLMVVVAPDETGFGVAEIVTTGGGTTATTTEFATCPPVPEHVRVKVVVADRGGVVSEPLSGFAPDHPPAAAHELAFEVDHERFTVAPAATCVALLENCSEGGGATT
jgi:hypothetical protein